MDLICAKCNEPWDVWTVHQELGDCAGDKTNAAAKQAFTAGRGCPSCDWGKTAPKTRSLRAEASGMLMDLLGDDLDGAAAMLEDFEMGF